jgi:phosphohistidine phosphatase
MKNLLLLRHAKSSWDHPENSDFERPLALRGEKILPVMGKVLEAMEPSVEKVFSSPAVRALETSRGVIREISNPPELVEYPPLYLAELPVFLQLTHSLSPELECVMFVGHNPGMESFCDWLCFGQQSGSTSLRTANLVWLELEIEDWKDTTQGCAVLRALLPSRLMKALF